MPEPVVSTMQDSPLTVTSLLRHGATVFADSVVRTYEPDAVREATYAEVARSIGRPSAARAVAGACASNGLAVAIPCHRVVRVDGGLGGFRWGVDRKRALLEAESGRTGGGTVRPGMGADEWTNNRILRGPSATVLAVWNG